METQTPATGAGTDSDGGRSASPEAHVTDEDARGDLGPSAPQEVGSAGPAARSAAPWADETHDAAADDLVGVLAYGELTGFMRLAADADMAPSLPLKTVLAALAVQQFGRFERLRGLLESRGVDPDQCMRPYAAAIDDYHNRTAPSDWVEGLVKAYVGDGIARDFNREVAALLDDRMREIVHPVLEQPGQAEFIVATVREALDAEPARAGRVALYARRLVGEALYQAQRVATEREHLTALLVGGQSGGAGMDLAEFGRLLARITDAHGQRMALLGLSA